MDNDDEQTGRILSRREVLALIGTAGVAALAVRATSQSGILRAATPAGTPASGSTLPACVVRPQQTEGPYFVDEKLNRMDIRSDPTNGKVSEGTLLDVEFRVMRVSGTGCVPLAGAVVDLWQCDALGVYAGVRDMGGRFDTTGQKFLRGYQVSDDRGIARFTTVYPGWYEGRAVHLHFKIRSDAGARAHEFTSQLYFDDTVTDAVLARPPYNGKSAAGRVRNERDGIFRRSGGEQLKLAVARSGAGYAGAFDIGLDLGIEVRKG